MLNNELNDYSKQDPFDEIDEPIFSESNLEGYSDFYKDSEESEVWWIYRIGVIGEFLFSFDKKKIYTLFLDYPHNMTEEEFGFLIEKILTGEIFSLGDRI